MIKVYYDIVDPNTVFGMVGRCGGGYNTVWEDWSDEGRAAREAIMREYEIEMNKLCGHYEKLEESVIKEGLRNPVIISCGFPRRCKMEHLPPELKLKPPASRLLLEGTTGGSRLWAAQKHNVPLPCFINDFSNSYKGKNRILTVSQARKLYKDPPKMLRMDARNGLVEQFDQQKVGSHLGEEWREDKLLVKRAPLYISIMNKYGYYVDRIPPVVQRVLKDVGYEQPAHLKKKHKHQ